MAVKKPLPKKYQSFEQNVRELAKDSLSKPVILQKLKLPANFFNVYTNPNPSDLFNAGREEFAAIVMKSVRSNLNFSPT